MKGIITSDNQHFILFSPPGYLRGGIRKCAGTGTGTDIGSAVVSGGSKTIPAAFQAYGLSDDNIMHNFDFILSLSHYFGFVIPDIYGTSSTGNNSKLVRYRMDKQVSFVLICIHACVCRYAYLYSACIYMCECRCKIISTYFF